MKLFTIKKKYILFFVLAFGLGKAAMAQQIPLLSTYYFNRFLLNPGMAGFNDQFQVFGFYRAQWTGMPGAPVTRGGTFDGSFWGGRSGVGMHVINDNTDIFKRISAQLTYAQKIRFAKDHMISLGVQAGIMDTRIDYQKATVTDNLDPTLYQQSQNRTVFDMNIGLTYSWKKKLIIGFAMPQVLNSTAKFTSQYKESKFQLKRHISASVSYEFNIAKEKFNITPMVVVRKGTISPVQVDATLMLDYKHMVYVGAAYRTDYGATVMAGVKLFKHLTLAYGYDINTNAKTKTAVGGSHEVIVGFSFGNGKSDLLAKKNAKRIDSLMQANKEIQKRLDTTNQKVDSLGNVIAKLEVQIDSLNGNSRTNTENAALEAKVKDLTERLDGMEDMVEQYNKKGRKQFAGSSTLEKGTLYNLSRIFFKTNSSILEESSSPELDRLAVLLKEKPSMVIAINGHTDFVDSDAYNLWLSDRRAKSIVDYLVNKGIDATRLKPTGFGKRLPIGDNTTDEGRAKNRRVEIEILYE